MDRKFPLGFWNYNRDGFFTGVDQVERWARLGMTMITAPEFRFGASAEKEKEMFAILDEAQKYGMTALMQVDRAMVAHVDEAELERRFREVYDKFGSHPALRGFYIGEEPDYGSIELFAREARVQKRVAPHLTPYMNLGSTERTERQLLRCRKSFNQWFCDIKAETGLDAMGFGNYSIMQLDEGGTEDFFQNLYVFVAAAENAGMDLWATLLSSAHYWFKAPDRSDYMRQINVCAASGCRGIIWFRLYDKPVAADYRSSPFNEYGEETASFAAMSEAQRHFCDHYGSLLMSLHHTTTYHITRAYGGYQLFPHNVHPLLRSVVSPQGLPGVLGFFTDDEGYEYITLVNNTHDKAGCFNLTFSDKTEVCDSVHYNGKSLGSMTGKSGEAFDEEVWLAPGQMEIIRIK